MRTSSIVAFTFFTLSLGMSCTNPPYKNPPVPIQLSINPEPCDITSMPHVCLALRKIYLSNKIPFEIPTNVEVCSWTDLGIACDGDEVTSLDLSNRGLSNLPIPLGDSFPHLRSLNLSDNKIAELPWFSFRGLSKLTTLRLKNNKIVSLVIQPSTGHAEETLFQDLKNVQILDLSDNQIASLSGTPLKGLSNLQSLDLSYNQISSLDPNILDGTGQISVNLSNNQFKLTYRLPAKICKGRTISPPSLCNP